MSEQQQGQRAWRWNDPAQEAERRAQHELLIDLLAAYVDEELPPETASQLDAHLVGCARCRREIQLQLAVRDSLGATPVAAARPALRDRIVAATVAMPKLEDGMQEPGPVSWTADERRAVGIDVRVPTHRRLAVWLLVAALPAIGGWAAWRSVDGAGRTRVTTLGASTASVPLLAAAAADFRRVGAADLPGPARDLGAVREAVGLPVEPLTGPGVRLLGAWTTTLAGEPTAVLAYRWDDRLVLQYIVPEQLFFRHPAVRAAAASHHRVGATDGTVGLVAWPLAAAGSVLVGEGSPERLSGALAR
jgi:anti-sigma factor RsiW